AGRAGRRPGRYAVDGLDSAGGELRANATGKGRTDMKRSKPNIYGNSSLTQIRRWRTLLLVCWPGSDDGSADFLPIRCPVTADLDGSLAVSCILVETPGMAAWSWLLWGLVAIGAVAVVYGLHRLGLWLEERGWLYYRNKRPSSSPMSAFVAMQQFIEP